MKLRRELLLFLSVGIVSTVVDLLTYFLLIHLGQSNNNSKAISFILGTYTGYIGNTRYTFTRQEGRFWKYTIVYVASLTVNIWVNSLSHYLLESRLWAWIIATGTSTTLNFLGLRYFTFAEKV